MSLTCKNCGHNIDKNSPICMHCGTAIPDADISISVKERMEQESCKKSSDIGSSIKAFGAFLIIIGIIVDVISMFMISSSDFGSFSVLTIIGTIAFLIGLAIVANS